MHKIIIEPHNVSITVEDGTLLKDSVEKYGIDFPCGGKGVCGNCHIELLEGNLEISDKQKEILIKKGLQGERWINTIFSNIIIGIRSTQLRNLFIFMGQVT